MALPKTIPLPAAATPAGWSFNHALAVTPNDSTDLAHVITGFMVGVAGNVVLDTVGGETVTVACVAGFWYGIRSTRIHATGTTATGIVGLYSN